MKKQPAIVKTSLEFDRDLWVNFRSVLLHEGKTSTAFLAKFIEKYVAERGGKGRDAR